jgi:hypothetical protein
MAVQKFKNQPTYREIRFFYIGLEAKYYSRYTVALMVEQTQIQKRKKNYRYEVRQDPWYGDFNVLMSKQRSGRTLIR